MEKIHLIGWIGLIMLVTASGVTVVVNSEAEAIAELASGLNIVQGNCEVLDIEKTVKEAGDISKEPYTITYSMNFTREGTQSRRVETVTSPTNDEETLKTLVEAACDARYQQALGEQVNIEKTVIIKYDNRILEQYYSPGSGKWHNKTTGQVE